MSLSINELESGGKSWTPDNVGDEISGTILTVERRQQTSFEGNTPLTWDDGSPRMLTYIELQTDLRDPEIDNDEGVRSLYAKGGNFEPADGKGTSMEKAIVDAVKKAGEKSIDEGATLTVRYSGNAKATTRGYRQPRLYIAKYEPPKTSVAIDDDLWDD